MDEGRQIAYRIAQEGDYERIVALQNENLLSSLDRDSARDGFLSGQFTAEQYKAMNEDLCVIVAVADQELAGYLCAESCEFNRPFPLVAHMMAQFDKISFGGRLLSDWRTCISGPVVVARSSRGSGVFAGLYGELKATLAGSLDVAVCFISEDNPRSLKAHVDKTGMEVLSRFTFAGRSYDILAAFIQR